jgi:hypothetical protein
LKFYNLFFFLSNSKAWWTCFTWSSFALIYNVLLLTFLGMVFTGLFLFSMFNKQFWFCFCLWSYNWKTIILVSLEMTSLLPFKLISGHVSWISWYSCSQDYGIFILAVKFLVCVAVGFYGKERATHVKLPVKTDQDTLREGYRYVLLCYYLQIFSWLHVFTTPLWFLFCVV